MVRRLGDGGGVELKLLLAVAGGTPAERLGGKLSMRNSGVGEGLAPSRNDETVLHKLGNERF